MGAALQSLADSWRIARRTPATIAVLIGLTVAIWVSSYITSLIPFLGFLLGLFIFAFGIGAMYAVTGHAAETTTTSVTAAVDILKEQWLPLLVAYGIIAICGFLLGLISVLPLFVVIVAIVFTGDITIGGIGFFVVVLWSSFLYFAFAMIMQFLLPAVVLGEAGGIESVVQSYHIIREQPLSVIGFTVARITIEYGPFLAGVVGALAVGWDAIVTMIEEFQAFAEEPPGDPAAGPDPVEILLGAMEPGPILTMAVLVLIGGTVGEVCRILYTTSYYRRVEPADIE